MNYTESGAMKQTVDYVAINKKYLLDTIMKQCGITNEDLRDSSIVKSKVRNSKLDNILDDDSKLL